MPFDQAPDEPNRPDRPRLDADRVAGQVQDQLGRPITLDEYTRIWNAVADYNGDACHIVEWVDVP